MTLLQLLQGLFMVLDGALQLLDVLGSALAEGGLCLPVPLLSLLGRCIDLAAPTHTPSVATRQPHIMTMSQASTYGLASALAFGHHDVFLLGECFDVRLRHGVHGADGAGALGFRLRLNLRRDHSFGGEIPGTDRERGCRHSRHV